MHGYFNNRVEKPDRLPESFTYKGLIFQLWKGHLTNEELKSGIVYFAFYGGRHLSASAIRYHVDRMIESGEYEQAA